MTHHSALTTAREWTIGIVLTFIIPLTTYYGVEVFNTYVRGMHEIELTQNMSQKEREEAIALRSEQYEVQRRTLFYAALIIGFASIIIGNFIVHGFLSLTIGLTLGGLVCLIMAYLWYWYKFGLLVKFGSLIAALALILFVAIYRLRRK